jgi:hypothetical protein
MFAEQLADETRSLNKDDNFGKVKRRWVRGREEKMGFMSSSKFARPDHPSPANLLQLTQFMSTDDISTQIYVVCTAFC